MFIMSLISTAIIVIMFFLSIVVSFLNLDDANAFIHWNALKWFTSLMLLIVLIVNIIFFFYKKYQTKGNSSVWKKMFIMIGVVVVWLILVELSWSFFYHA